MSPQDGKLQSVLQSLRALAPRLVEPKPVRDDAARQLHARRQQHRGPEHRVLTQNVFAEQVKPRPELLEEVARLSLPTLTTPAERRDVVDERVEPDVDGVARVAGHGYRPTDRTLQARSEEHTSELQSRQYLVCRLL